MIRSFRIIILFNFITVIGFGSSSILWADHHPGLHQEQSEGLLTDTSSWYAQAVAADSSQSSKAHFNKPLKAPGTAIGLATFPGIVVHGSGHFYAGRPITGVLMLLAEAGAVYMAYQGVSDVYTVVDENLNGNLTDIEIIENLSETEKISQGIGLAAGGLVLFLSSWFYDMSGAPIVVEMENAKQKKGAKVEAQLTLQGVELVISQLF